MRTTQEHMVVALPTDKRSQLQKLGINKYWAFDTHYERYKGYDTKYFHLYFFLSDEDIKEGDWFIVDGQVLLQYKNDSSLRFSGKGTKKKVIATTNPDLWYKDEPYFSHISQGHEIWKTRVIQEGLPKIDTTFIEAFVREQGKIDKVLLEYEKDNVWNTSDFAPSHLKLKPNGSVIVHPVKERMYTRGDMLNVALKAFNLKTTDVSSITQFQEWFNKHYLQ